MHLVQVELGQSQSVNIRSEDYGFPIVSAAVVGNNQILKLLLEKGANPDAVSLSDHHALLAAVDRSNVCAVKILLENGAMSDLKTWSTEDSKIKIFAELMVKAVKKGQLPIIKLILQNRKPLARDVAVEKFYEHIIEPAVRGGDVEIVRLLIESGVIGPNRGFDDALLAAVTQGKDDIAHMMLDKSANFTIHQDAYDSALREAVSLNNEPIVLKLTENGANVNTSSKFASTVLCAAVNQGHTNIARILLEHEADVKVGRPLCSVLLSASSDLCSVMVPMLLEHGADPNQPLISAFGHSLPLHTALSRGMADIVKLLLDAGADVNRSSSKYANASGALDSCEDAGKRAACKALLPSASMVQSPVETESRDGEKPAAHEASPPQENMVRSSVETGIRHREKVTARKALVPKRNIYQ